MPPMLRAKVRRNGRRPTVNTLRIGEGSTCFSCCCSRRACSKTGASRSRLRSTYAATVTKALEKNTTRQPQASSWSGGSSWARIHTTAPSAVPAEAPTNTSEA